MPYKDQLGFYTIGFGHLIRKNEKKFMQKKFSKKFFEELFEKDFNKSVIDFKKISKNKKYNQQEKELIIEMIFQMGVSNVKKFTKMFYFLNKKQYFMVCLEMMDSLWYRQTPSRVINLIDNFLR